MEYTIREPDRGEKIIYKLTRNGPEEFHPDVIHLVHLTKSLYRFLYEYFRGAIRLHIEGEPFGTIRVCPSGVAFFIKLLLVEAYGNSLIKANFKCTQREFSIEILHELGNIDVSYLLKVAEKSGFEVVLCESGHIIISTKVIRDPRPSFYNPGANYLDNVIAYVFFQ